MDVYALANKGVVMYDLHKYTEAIRYYDKALAIDSRNINALNNKGNALVKLVENIRPIEYHYQPNTSPTPYPSYVIYYYTDLPLLNYGSYTEVIKYFDKALAIDPNATGILGNKGITLMLLHYYNDAVKLFDKIYL